MMDSVVFHSDMKDSDVKTHFAAFFARGAG